MMPSLLLAAAPAATTAWFGTGLVVVGVLLLALALVVQGERLATLQRDLDALRQPPEAVPDIAPRDRSMFGSLYDEPEPSLVERVAMLVRTQPVRVATGLGVVAIVGGLVWIGGTTRTSLPRPASYAELTTLKAAHDSLRTALAVIASGAMTAPVAAARTAPDAAPPRSLAAERPAPAPLRRASTTSASAARPSTRSAVPSAAILPPPPRLGASSPLPSAPVVLETPALLPSKP